MSAHDCLYIERNGQPFRARYIPIPSTRKSFSPVRPGVPAAAEPVAHRSACGLSPMEAR